MLRALATLSVALGVLPLAAQIRPDHNLATLTPEEAQAVRDFEERLKEYVLLHRKLESTLPKLPREATAEQLDAHQKQLGETIAAARPDARPGAIFTRGMQELVRRATAGVQDESPDVPDLKVNEPYPDAIELSTMPPQALAKLPKLPEGLEYRLAGGRLVLIDIEARLLVDVTEVPTSPRS